MQRRCSSNPLVSTDCLRVTKGYDLPCKYVFHLITPNTAQELTHRVKIVLDEAKKLGITSISFPTLGAGKLHFKLFFATYVNASQEISKSHPFCNFVKLCCCNILMQCRGDLFAWVGFYSIIASLSMVKTY